MAHLKVFALLSLVLFAAALTLTNVDFDVQEGRPFTLAWVPDDQAVTVQLVHDPSTVVKNISTNATGGSLAITLRNIDSGVYYFSVTDNLSQESDTSSTFTLSGSATTSTPPESSSPSSSGGISTGAAAAIGVVVGIVVVLVIAGAGWFCYRRRQRKRAGQSASKDDAGTTTTGEQLPPEASGNPLSEVGGGQVVAQLASQSLGAYYSNKDKSEVLPLSPVAPLAPHAPTAPVELSV